MNGIRLALEHRLFTAIVSLMLLALGIHALQTIPRTEDPVFPMPGFNIVAVAPGTTPDDVERLIVDPIEESLAELGDIKRLDAEIWPGMASLRLELTANANVDDKHQEVQRQINAVRGELPESLALLDLWRWSATNVAIMQLALVAPGATYEAQRAAAERIEKRLERVRAVQDVDVFGLPEPVVRVATDATRAAALGVHADEIAAAIRGSNQIIPSGSVDFAARRLDVKTDAELATLEDLEQVVVRADWGSVLRLSDLAAVDLDHAPAMHLTRLDGQAAVFFTVTQKDGYNVLATREELGRVIDAVRGELGDDMRLLIGFDQSENVRARLDALQRDLLLALGLVLLTLLPLGLRAAAVVMISVPLSMAVGLWLLDALGFTINQLSIAGFVIALGLLVDDPIVVIENIARLQRAGLDRARAVIEGATQIAPAVVGCTATLLLAFAPLLFLPGTPGAFIRSLPVTVVLTIAASLLVSLTTVPLLAMFMLSKHEHAEGNAVLRVVNAVIDRSYGPLLGLSVRFPRSTVFLAGLALAGSLALVPTIGFSLFPKAGIPQFRVTVELADGTPLDQTDVWARRLEADLLAQPGVRHVMTNVGRGNPTMYYNVTPQREQSNYAELLVQLDDPKAGTDGARFDALRARYAQLAGARIEVKEFQNGPPIEAPIALRILGDELAQLEHAATLVEAALEGTPGTRDVSNPGKRRSLGMTLQIDHAQAAQLGVRPADVARAARLSLSGLRVGTLRSSDGVERDIMLELEDTRSARAAAAPSPAIFAQVFTRSHAGAPVALSQLATAKLEDSPAMFRHAQRVRCVVVSASVQSGLNVAKVTSDALARIERLALPEGVRVEPAGEHESREESLGGVGVAAIIAMFGILAVLVLEFASLRGAAIVLSVVPLGLIGGLLALYLTGHSLSFTASIGFVALMGIEVKSSILLVDTIGRLRAQGEPLDAAIRRAGETRFLPILLTTLTALGGLLPLAQGGSSLYSPLAVVLIGGLITSTVLTRVVTPAVYKLMPPPSLRTPLQ